jgi:L-iditol 2-dehydrogenase
MVTSPVRSGNPAAVLYAPRDVRIEDAAVPGLDGRDVLIEIRSVGVCGSDVHYFEEGRIGGFVVKEPLVLGHEASGVVVARGREAHRHEIGTRVAIEPGVPCRVCEQCRAGRYNLCPDVRFLATPPVNGAFTRYLVMPEDFCYQVPDSLSDDAAALIEPLSVAVWACRKAHVTLGDQVLVTGAGPIGLLTARVARAAGAEATVCDINPARLARAAASGAGRTIDLRETSLAGLGSRFSAFVECSGAPGVPQALLGALRPAGHAVLVGMSADDDLRLPLSLIQTRELTITGTFRYAGTYPAAIALAASGTVQLDDLVDAAFALRDAGEALQATRRSPDLLKVMVRPQE